MTRTPPEYFERMYDANHDPWGFETSWYERRKYALTLASLPAERYGSAFEAGCSIGVLTEGLARRCDRVLAVDRASSAVASASQRLGALAHVRVERRALPEEWPAGPFDLLVLSEVAYYFDADELRGLLERARQSLGLGATVVAAHWRGTTNYPLTGDETHGVLADRPWLRPVAHHLEDDFVLDVWRVGP